MGKNFVVEVIGKREKLYRELDAIRAQFIMVARFRPSIQK